MARARTGSVYVISLSLAAVCVVYSAAVLLRGTSELNLSERSSNQTAAFQLAEAGVDQGARNLRTNSTTDDVLFTALAAGSFSVGEPVTVDSTRRRFTTVGTSDQEQRRLEVVVSLTPQSVFQYALFGSDQVMIGGNAITDAYDSTLGAYQPDASQPGYNFSKDGDVGTNATTASPTSGITVDGTSLVVNGQVVVGPDVADPTSVVDGNVNDDFITGGPPKYVSSPLAFPMEPVAVPQTCTSTLPPLVEGTRTFTSAQSPYCLSGDVVINGNETVTTSGSVQVYLSGALTINGNATVGVPSNPSALIFLMTPTAEATIQQGDLQGNAKIYAGIYAPDSKVAISGNAEILGSVIGESVDVSGNAKVHYDTAMGEFNAVTNLNKITLLSWREL